MVCALVLAISIYSQSLVPLTKLFAKKKLFAEDRVFWSTISGACDNPWPTLASVVVVYFTTLNPDAWLALTKDCIVPSVLIVGIEFAFQAHPT